MYLLGSNSLSNLANVHIRLVNVVKFAINITQQDFSVVEGVRSVEDEMRNIRAGTSRVKNPRDSQHVYQNDGYGHAVDLAPYVDDKINWDWAYVYPIAFAMKNAAKTLGVRLRWGGVWDKCLNDLSDDMKKEMNLYAARHAGSDLLDGVHFEIDKSDLIYKTKEGQNEGMV